MRETLKGHHLEIPEINELFVYWFCARFFNFTPAQVDDIPSDTLAYLLDMDSEYQKQQNKQK